MHNLFLTRNNLTRQVALYLTPLMVFAAPLAVQAQNLQYFRTLLIDVGNILGLAVPVLIALALLLFIWGLVVFIANAGSDQARAEGKQKMVWGIIALFVIVSVWGLVRLLNQITDVQQGDNVTVPGIPEAL